MSFSPKADSITPQPTESPEKEEEETTTTTTPASSPPRKNNEEREASSSSSSSTQQKETKQQQQNKEEKEHPLLEDTHHASFGPIKAIAQGNTVHVIDSTRGDDVLLTDLTTLRGHSAACACVRFSPHHSSDMKHVASAGADGSIMLWDGDTGRPVKTFRSNIEGKIFSIEFSPDSKLLVAGIGVGGKIVFYDMKTKQAKHEQLRHGTGNSAVGCLSFTKIENSNNTTNSNEKFILASGGGDGIIRLWDYTMKQPKPLVTLEGHTAWISAIKFLNSSNSSSNSNSVYKNKRIIFSAAHDGIRCWDVTNLSSSGGKRQVGNPIRAHSSYCLCLDISPNGKYLLSGGMDGLKCWSTETHDPVCPTDIMMLSSSSSSSSADNNNANSSSSYSFEPINIDHLQKSSSSPQRQQQQLSSSSAMKTNVIHVASSSSNNNIFGSMNSPTKKDENSNLIATGRISFVSFSPTWKNQPQLVVFGDKKILLLDLNTFEIKNVPTSLTSFPSEKEKSLSSASASVTLLSFSASSTTRTTTTKTTTPTSSIQNLVALGHLDHITSCCWRNDGRCLATCADDKLVKLFDVCIGTSLSPSGLPTPATSAIGTNQTFECTSPVKSIEFLSKLGNPLEVKDENGRTKVWPIENYPRHIIPWINLTKKWLAAEKRADEAEEREREQMKRAEEAEAKVEECEKKSKEKCEEYDKEIADLKERLQNEKVCCGCF